MGARVLGMFNFSLELILGLIVFAAVSSITPGPNNLMIMSSGLNYGFRRSLPHLLGISIGFGVMVLLIGLGAQSLFERYPFLHALMKYVGAAYLGWLALKIATAPTTGVSGTTRTLGKPFSFLQAAAFQWVNPKAWVMALAALTAYLPQPFSMVDVAMLSAVFTMVNLPCVGTWAGFGVGLRHILSDPVRMRLFNWATALLLLASIYPIILAS